MNFVYSFIDFHQRRGFHGGMEGTRATIISYPDTDQTFQFLQKSSVTCSKKAMVSIKVSGNIWKYAGRLAEVPTLFSCSLVGFILLPFSLCRYGYV